MNTRNSITSQDEKLVNMQMSIGYKSGLQKQLKMVYMTITNNCCPIQRVIRGLSRMKGNFHVRFLEEGEGAISPSYSAMTRMHADQIIRVACPEAQEGSKTNRTFGGKQNTMYVQRVKIPLHGSAPVQRKKVVRYCEISCRVPEYRQPQPETIREPEVASVRCDIPTRDGSLSREMITEVVMVGMAANAFLCDRGRSLNVLLEIEPHPTSFWVNSLSQWDKGSGSITLKGKTKAMHYETSDEPIVAMKVKPVKYRTCIAGCRGRLYEDKT